jgi:phosphatidylglycerol:prolipoprotein diacylglycerol transferase
VVLYIMIRAGALRRPGLILGAFSMTYALIRSFCEFFREPDPQLGFLWGHTTMGMLLCIPLFIFGAALAVSALRRQPLHS